MKKSILTLLFFAFTLQAYMIPSWYPDATSAVIVSYGDGESLELAKQDALESIKKQLIDKNQFDILEVLTVSDLDIIKQEILENRVFIQVSYENLSTTQKIDNVLKKQVFKTEDETNNYLLQTGLLKDINNSYGYFADIGLDSNKTAYLSIAGEQIALKPNDYPLFYVQYSDENISLEIDTNLTQNDLYFMNIESKSNGYLSIVQISLEHDVVVLLDNKQIDTNEMVFPNFKESDGLVATLEENQEEREILTIAFLCEEQKDLRGFNNMFSSEIIYGKLGALIETMDNCLFSSSLSTIRQGEQ